MEVYRGIPVYPGVVIGPALLLDTEGYLIPQRSISASEVVDEFERLKIGIRDAAIEVRSNQAIIATKVGTQYGAILGAHAQMIEDPFLLGEIESLISKKFFTAEYALSLVMRKHIKEIQSLPDARMASRATDLFDIEKQILGKLIGQRKEGLNSLSEPVVILAHDLSPSETAKLNTKLVQKKCIVL